MYICVYHLVMTNIAMENPPHQWRFLAGNIIYFYGPGIPGLCEITRGYLHMGYPTW